MWLWQFMLYSMLALAIGIRDCECGPFRPNFRVFAISDQVGNTTSPWGKKSSQGEGAVPVANDQWSMVLGLRVRFSGLAGVLQLMVRARLPICACCFLPRCVTIPSGNSKQAT